ncbi:MAG: SpoIIE family protein phosphatase [Bacteroidales bacterium]|nr:SpoIIE family protein phosphatase [Bacteroidales bacterium]
MKYLKINIFIYLQFIIILFFLLIHNSNNCFAQTNTELGSPFIRNYTSAEYNAETQNWAIVQDKRGIMYFGNNIGILEFDGINWKLIKVPNNSIVRSLTIDNNGVIYVGASTEFGFLASDSIGQLLYVSLMNKLSETDKNFNDVWKICPTSHGVYFLTINKIFRLYNDTINIIPANLAPLYGFVINDELFVCHRDSGLCIVKDNKLKSLLYCQEFTSGYGRIIVLPYSKNEILIGTEKKGFFILPVGRQVYDISSSILEKFHTEIDKYIYYNDFYSALKVNDTFIFASLKGGIVFMNKKGELLRIINKNRGLQNNSVYSIYIDNSNNLWAALENGISEIEISCPITIFNELSGLEGLVLSTTRHKGKIYASTSQGIYYLPDYKMDINNDKYNFVHVNNTKSFYWNFFSLDNFLLASGSYLTLIQDSVAKEFKNLPQIYCFGKSDKFPEHIFFGLYEGFASIKYHINDKNDNEQNNYSPEFVDFKKFNDINDPIRKIVSDNNGNLWLTAEYSGIIHIKFTGESVSDYKLIHYDTSKGLPQLANNFVHFIDNKLIVATQQGIYKAIEPDDSIAHDSVIKFIPDTSFGQLFSDNTVSVAQISVDKNNKTWINSENMGIGTLTKNQGTSDKWYNTPFNKIPLIYYFFTDINQIVWTCTGEGLFRYDANIEKNYTEKFNSLIRKVTINNDSIIFYGTNYNDTIKKGNYFIINSLFQPQQLIPVLDYKNNSIKFEFTAPFYERISANSFKYILDGFDKEWSDWTSETKKEYTNLPEGNYTFKVISKNIFNTESQEAVYSFSVLPPWYRTILVYIFYVISFIIILFLGIKINTRRLKAANLHLESLVSKRTAEIQQQKEEIQVQAENLVKTNAKLKKLSTVVSKTDNAVMIMDADGNFEWINEGYTRLYGYTFEQLIDKIGWNIIETSNFPEIKKVVEECINEKRAVIYQNHMYSLSGEKIWAQTTLTPIFDDNGELINLVIIDSNITKIKKAEKEIIRQRDEITDSILYAKRIQTAIFPSDESVRELFNDYFILNKPKGIVSGDFFWVSKVKDKIIVAVADCTGHGVPGAFMSMLGVTSLNKIVNEKTIIKPNEILDRLRNNIIASLHQTGEIGEANDGMDIALITIDKNNNFLEYAGANNSAYLFQNNELIEIFADKMPIGIYSEIETPFSCQKMSFQTGDIIYLFTDGYADQFGGSRGRKFLYKNFKTLLKEIHHLPMNEQETKLFKTHRKWKDNNEQVDDILIMGIKI